MFNLANAAVVEEGEGGVARNGGVGFEPEQPRLLLENGENKLLWNGPKQTKYIYKVEEPFLTTTPFIKMHSAVFEVQKLLFARAEVPVLKARAKSMCMRKERGVSPGMAGLVSCRNSRVSS